MLLQGFFFFLMNFTSSTLSVETSEVPGLLLGARDKKGNPTVTVPVGPCGVHLGKDTGKAQGSKEYRVK